jgi:small subunit ribosomal protein S13
MEEKQAFAKSTKLEGKDYGVIRILSKDIEGRINVYTGLTKIKGISWTMSHIICTALGIPKTKKIGELTQDEIKKIVGFFEEPKIPLFLLNRRKDFEMGTSRHLLGSDLDLKKEFDIKRLKKIRTYRGVRHTLGQPVRGQRTKSHFRAKGRKAVGVQKSKEAKKK